MYRMNSKQSQGAHYNHLCRHICQTPSPENTRKIDLVDNVVIIAQSTDLDRTFGTDLGNDPLEAVQPLVVAGDVVWPHHRPSPAVTMVVEFRRKITNANFALGPGLFC